MLDGIKKNNGRSRLMKAAITASTSWEEFRALLLAGELLFDMEVNRDTHNPGWQVFGTDLSKENLLNDETGQGLGFSTEENPTVNNALYRLMALIAAKSFSNALEDVEIEVNSVVGSGYTDYTFKKPFTDVPTVLAWDGVTLKEVINVTALTMQISAPASFIAIYDGGVI